MKLLLTAALLVFGLGLALAQQPTSTPECQAQVQAQMARIVGMATKSLVDTRDLLLAENERLKARIAELEAKQ